MLTPRFVIFVETVTGEIIQAFTWCRDEASGLARARRDSIDFGYGYPTRVWAEPINIANDGV
jgi:hypothetical protein